MKHGRKGSKSSLREVLLDDEMFQMEDVNDAEDELGGSEPEIGTASDQFFDQEFYQKLNEIRAEKPKLAMSSLPVDSIGIDYEDDSNLVEDTERTCPDIITETVYVDTSAPTFHYYSDGEDRSEQRPGTPGVFSDSELENHNHSEQNIWRWGELPNTSPAPPTPQAREVSSQQAQGAEEGETSSQEQKTESRRSWFGWSKSQDIKKERPETGVYLDDLVNNPELLPKYLNPIKMEASDPLDVSQPILAEESPAVTFPAADPGEVVSEEEDCESRTGLSLPMSPQGAKYDSDCETTDRDLPSLISRHLPDLAASLCGGLSDSTITPGQFEEHLLTYDQFLEKVSNSAAHGVLSDPNLVIRVHEKYLSWDKAAPILLSLLLYKQPLPSDIVGKIIKDGLDVNINISPEDIAKSKADDDTVTKASSWFGWWGANNRTHASEIIKKEGIKTIVEGEELKKIETITESSPEFDSLDSLIDGKKFRKSLRLTSEQIEELNLEPGMNEVQFSVTTAFQGTSVAKCHIFLWRNSDKLVISDIDGTITKSDVLGHILPAIGKDWAHSGVADLYTKIHENGYKIIYLSARAIGQSSITKDYLQSVKQGKVWLPDGPVFLNPDSLIHAFRREVIDRNPEEFKIRCLKDIQSLFGETNPFFAGYGNRPNDAYAYRAVGISVSRIFTINPAGKLKLDLIQNFTSSYIEQDSIVDHVFPPTGKDGFDPEFEIQEFSSFGFWRPDIEDLNPEDLTDFTEQNEKVESTKKKKK